MKKKLSIFIAIALLLIGAIGGYWVRSSAGTVDLIEINIPDNAGTYIHATIFKPKTATAQTPAPVVVTCHGYSDTGEKQDFAAIELSRRGVVVVEMDALSHGLSSTSTYTSSPGSTFGEAVGMIRVVDFISKSNMDYIDKTRIGITGHSMGGHSTRVTLEYYGGLQTEALAQAALPESDGGAEITQAERENAEKLNVISAAFIQSALPSTDVNAYGNYYRNVALNYTYYDEGNYRNAGGNGDMATAPEAIAFINASLTDGSSVDKVEIGKFYGSAEDGTLRVVYNPATTHTFEYMTPASAENLIEFFTVCLGIQTDLAQDDLVFLWRFVLTGLGLIGLAMLVPAFLRGLVKTASFAGIVMPVPQAKLTLESKKSKQLFWGSWVLLTVITAVCLVPVIRLDATFFPVVAGMGYAKTYTSVNVNSFAIWCVFISLVSLALFMVCYHKVYKKDGLAMADLGLKVTGKQLLHSILLALCVGIMFYIIVFAAYYLFHVDFRMWNISAKPFTPDKISMFVQYLPWFLFYMIVQSITTNVSNRIRGQKGNLAIVALCNIAGLFIIGVFAYGYLFTQGVSFPAWASAWDRVAQVFPFMLYTLGTVIISRKAYEMTGSIWTGSFVNAFIVTMMLVANTSDFYLLG